MVKDTWEVHSYLKGTETHEFVTFPLVAKALAVRSAIKIAVSMDIWNLHFYSDSTMLIRAINKDQHVNEIY